MKRTTKVQDNCEESEMDGEKSILIVDRNEAVRRALATTFGREGYETETAGTAREAVEKVEKRLFSLAILGIVLPDMQGTELVGPLKEMYPDMGIIMMSGHASRKTRIRALNDGAMAYFSKPLNIDEVLTVVGKAFEKQRLVIENRRLYRQIQREVTERKRVVEALEISERRFRSMTERNADGIVIIDRNGIVRFANPASQALFGQDGGDISGGLLGVPVVEDEAAELEIFDERGEMSVVEMRVSETEWAGESVFLATLRDITGRKRAGEIVKKERDFISAVVDTAGSLVVVLDRQERIVRFNRACERTTGYSLDEVKGRCIWDLFVAPEDVEIGKLMFDNLRAGHVPDNVCENYWLTKDGNRRLITWSNTVLPGNDGSVEYIIATGIDVTQREQAEKSLRESENRYRELWDGAPVAYHTLDTEGIITCVNETEAKMLGYTKEEMVGESVFEFILPEQRKDAKQEFEQKLAGEKILKVEDRVYVRKDGSEILVSIDDVLERDGAGNVIGIRATMVDITKEKLLHGQLIQSEKLAAIGELVSGVAHEINNPLTAMIGFAQLLKRDAGGLDKDKQEQLEMVFSQGMRVKKIVANLLSFARRGKAERKEVNINGIVETVLGMRSYELRVNNINVHTEFEEKLSYVEVDAQQIEQVFLNMMNNAEQAMSEAHGKGNLTIRIYGSDDVVRVEFMDDGPGIAKENLENIFDPFFTTKEAGKGTGLGLSVSYGIIKEHGGNILVESEEGKGTKFIIELPIVKGEPDEKGEDSHS